MANKKITDATTATSVAGTDKVFLNQGGDLKQVDLNSAVANSQAVQTLNSNLSIKVLVNEAGARLIQIGHIYMLFLQGFDFFSNSAILDKIIKYAPKDQVRNVVGDYENKTTYVLALSSNNKTLINIKIWQEVPNTTATGIHGTLIWIKS